MTTETTKKTAYEIACDKLGRKPATIEDFNHEMEEDRKMEFGEHKLKTCIKAANLDENGKPFIPDWKDWNQDKWRGWMDAFKTEDRPSGVGFRFSCSGYACDFSSVGSRLYSRKSETVKKLLTDPEVVEYWNEMMGV